MNKQLNGKIYIDQIAFAKFKYWESLAKGEVSAMGKVVILEGVPYVHEIVLLKQECTAATTDICPDSLNKALYDLREVQGNMACWIHSHNTMATFWSATDYDTIADFGTTGYIVSIVTNNDGDIKGAIYYGGDDNTPAIFNEDVEVVVGVPFLDSELEELKEQFDELVSYPAPITYLKGGKDSSIGDYKFKRNKKSPIPKEDWYDWYDDFYLVYGSEPLNNTELNAYYNKVMLEEKRGQNGKV